MALFNNFFGPMSKTDDRLRQTPERARPEREYLTKQAARLPAA
jgi:hypothetical protein